MDLSQFMQFNCSSNFRCSMKCALYTGCFWTWWGRDNNSIVVIHQQTLLPHYIKINTSGADIVICDLAFLLNFYGYDAGLST